jgi:hypothetical protein
MNNKYIYILFTLSSFIFSGCSEDLNNEREIERVLVDTEASNNSSVTISDEGKAKTYYDITPTSNNFLDLSNEYNMQLATKESGNICILFNGLKLLTERTKKTIYLECDRDWNFDAFSKFGNFTLDLYNNLNGVFDSSYEVIKVEEIPATFVNVTGKSIQTHLLGGKEEIRFFNMLTFEARLLSPLESLETSILEDLSHLKEVLPIASIEVTRSAENFENTDYSTENAISILIYLNLFEPIKGNSILKVISEPVLDHFGYKLPKKFISSNTWDTSSSNNIIVITVIKPKNSNTFSKIEIKQATSRWENFILSYGEIKIQAPIDYSLLGI